MVKANQGRPGIRTPDLLHLEQMLYSYGMLVEQMFTVDTLYLYRGLKHVCNVHIKVYMEYISFGCHVECVYFS